jgi:hypothetical protein
MTEKELLAADGLKEAHRELIDASRELPRTKDNQHCYDRIWRLVKSLDALERKIRLGVVCAIVALLFAVPAQAETFWVARHNVTKKVWLIWAWKPQRCDYRFMHRNQHTIRKEEYRRVKR